MTAQARVACTTHAVLVHSLNPALVVLADHDPVGRDVSLPVPRNCDAWVGERARLVDHFGSIAVPGLAAKPVVDVLVGIDDPDDEATYLPDLEAAGYDLTVSEPQYRCLRYRAVGGHATALRRWVVCDEFAARP